MSNESFKVKNGLTLTPVDLTTLTSPQAGDLACDINDSNKIKRYDSTTSTWVVAGGGLSAWTTATPYAVSDVVTYSKQAFICLTAHTAAASMEADIASGYWQLLNLPQQSRNYMLIGNNFEDNDAGGWQLFTIAGYVAGSNPSVAPTLGSATSLTVGTTATSPLSGKHSLIIGNTASTNITAGQGIISQVFSIDRVDQAKVLATQFAYEVANGAVNMVFGTTSANTFGVFIYDVTNSAWIQPTGVYSLNQKTGVGKTPSCNWQTPVNMTQFKVAVLCMNTTTATTPAANALQMKFDDFFTGPSNYVYGTPITDWASFSMTIGATTTAPTRGTTTSEKAYWRRNGQNMEIMYSLQMSAAGSVGFGAYLFTLPSGYTMDTTQIKATTGASAAAFGTVGSMIGTGTYATTTAGNTAIAGTLSALAYGTNQILFASNATVAGPSPVMYPVGSSNSIFGSAANFTFKVSVPITGWSSSVQMSDNAAQNVVDFVGYVASNQALTADVTNMTLATLKDSAGAWTGSTYVVPVSGDYLVGGAPAMTTNSTSASVDVWVNGVDKGRCSNSIGVQSMAGGSVLLNDLKSGDVIAFRAHNSGFTSLADSAFKLYIQRLSGPASIAATETVAASYYASANTTASTSAPFNFDTKIYDSHSAVTVGSAWKFTSPTAGVYSGSVYVNASSAPAYILLYKNGSFYMSLGYGPVNAIATLPFDIKLNSGDYIEVRASASTVANGGSLAANITSWISIKKIGLL